MQSWCEGFAVGDDEVVLAVQSPKPLGIQEICVRDLFPNQGFEVLAAFEQLHRGKKFNRGKLGFWTVTSAAGHLRLGE